MSTRTDYRDRLLEVLPENEALRTQLAEAVALLRRGCSWDEHDCDLIEDRMDYEYDNEVDAFLARFDGASDGKAGV